MIDSESDQDEPINESDDLDFGAETEEQAAEQPEEQTEENIELSEEEEAPVLERREPTGLNRQKRAVFSVPVEVTVSVGCARPLIGDLLKMRRDALIPLDSKIEDPVELRVAGRVIARGELQEMDDGSNHLAVRLTEIIDMNDAL